MKSSELKRENFNTEQDYYKAKYEALKKESELFWDRIERIKERQRRLFRRIKIDAFSITQLAEFIYYNRQ